MKRICKYCTTEFNDIKGRVFSNHVRWCNSNPTRNNMDNGQSKLNASERYDKRYGKNQLFTLMCICGNEYTIFCRKRDLSNPKIVKKFCSRKCANKRTVSTETKRKISKTMIDNKSAFKRTSSKYPYTKSCIGCGTNIMVTSWRVDIRKYCSTDCRNKKRQQNMTELNKYRRDGKFKFALNSYPDEFEFDLITKYGWYKAKNRGNNLNGVSRDHMIPIMYGWKHNISPDIISHPANCQLLRHNDNVSKGTNPSITLESLIIKIDSWDITYKK